MASNQIIGAGAGAGAQTSVFDFSINSVEKLKTLEDCVGLFTFGLFRNTNNDAFFTRINQFQQGISQYIELTKRKVFEGWAVLVYIDESILNVDDSYEKNHTGNTVENHKIQLKEFLEFLSTEPTCLFCKYTFPQFILPGTLYHFNFIGSMARFHALLQFPKKYICIRDADTYFPDLWDTSEYLDNSLGYNVASQFTDTLEEWEYNCLQVHSSKGLPILIAYERGYNFYNYRTKPFRTVTRFLAGLINAIPRDPSLFPESLWNSAINFLQDKNVLYKIRGYHNTVSYVKSPKTYRKNTNAEGLTYYGCDEKILRFIFFDAWKENIVPFYFPYSTVIQCILDSYKDNPKGWLSIYKKLLDPILTPVEKESDLVKLINIYSEYYSELPEDDRETLKDDTNIKVPGVYNFLLMPKFPLIAEDLANEYEEGLPDNIKGGFTKSGKTRKQSGRKSLGKSRKNR